MLASYHVPCNKRFRHPPPLLRKYINTDGLCFPPERRTWSRALRNNWRHYGVRDLCLFLLLSTHNRESCDTCGRRGLSLLQPSCVGDVLRDCRQMTTFLTSCVATLTAASWLARVVCLLFSIFTLPAAAAVTAGVGVVF